MLRKAVICGSGSMANHHASFLKKEGYQIVAVKSTNPNRAPYFKEKFKAKFYTSLEEILANEQFDLVIISSIPSEHLNDFEIAMKSSAKKIIIEKPLASTIEEAEKIYKITLGSNKDVSVCYPFNYSREYKLIKRIIYNRKYGQLNSIFCDIAFPRKLNASIYPYKWWIDKRKSGGGPVFQVGIHWLSFIFSLLEYENVYVLSKYTRLNCTYNIEDSVNAIISSKSNNCEVLINIAMTSTTKYENRTIVFQFDEATVIYLNGTVFQLSPNSKDNIIRNPFRIVERLFGNRVHSSQTKCPDSYPYKKYMRQFLSSTSISEKVVANAYFDVKIAKQLIE